MDGQHVWASFDGREKDYSAWVAEFGFRTEETRILIPTNEWRLLRGIRSTSSASSVYIKVLEKKLKSMSVI